MESNLGTGEMRSAREELASAINLPNDVGREIVEGIGSEFEEQLGTDDNDKNLIGDIFNAVKPQTADFVAGLNAEVGPVVKQQEIRRALRQVTPTTMRQVANPLRNSRTTPAQGDLSCD